MVDLSWGPTNGIVTICHNYFIPGHNRAKLKISHCSWFLQQSWFLTFQQVLVQDRALFSKIIWLEWLNVVLWRVGSAFWAILKHWPNNYWGILSYCALEPSINDVTQNFHIPIHAIYQKYYHVLHNPLPPLGVLSLTSFMDDPFPLPSIPLRENEVVKSASKDWVPEGGGGAMSLLPTEIASAQRSSCYFCIIGSQPMHPWVTRNWQSRYFWEVMKALAAMPCQICQTKKLSLAVFVWKAFRYLRWPDLTVGIHYFT